MSLFFYVHPDNPQARLIRQACEMIRQGEVVVVQPLHLLALHALGPTELFAEHAAETTARSRSTGRDPCTTNLGGAPACVGRGSTW